MPETIVSSETEKASSDFEKSENSKFADKSVIASAETIRDIEESKEIENLKKVEAAMFLSARFLNLQELIMLTDINPLMLKELLEKLTEKYNKEDSAIEIVSKENMWKMDVRQEYVGMVNKLATGNAEFSKAEQETLAVIAYKQPVKQSVIIKIRGNKAYEHIKNFREIGLVQSKPEGHTIELRLSDDFFEYFHLQKRGEQMLLDDPESSEHSEEFSDLQKREFLNGPGSSEYYEELPDLQKKGETIVPEEEEETNKTAEQEENQEQDLNPENKNDNL